MDMDERNRQLSQLRKERYQADYDPGYTPGSMPDPNIRIANALDYIAFQMGQINQKLGTVIAALESKT